jgi:predicted flap endonuclease-1-like 5' DNA nuclease
VPAAPVDSVTRFQDVLTGTQRQSAQVPVPVAPVSAPVAVAVTAAGAAAAKMVSAPAAPVSAPPAPAPAPVPVAATIAPPTPIAAPKVVTPAAPVPSTISAPALVATPSTAPFTIPTPGPTRTGVSLPTTATSVQATTVAAAATAAIAPAASAVTPTAPAVKADDLTRIRAIDSSLHAKLHQLGVRRYADIAAWTPADVTRVSQSLGFQGRIEQENWIEQAQILSRGGETAFARRKDRGEASLSAPSADQGTPKAISTAPVNAPVTAGLVAAVATPVASAIVAAAKPAVAPAPVASTLAPVVAAPAAAATAVATAVAAHSAQPLPAMVADRAAFANQRVPATAPASPSVVTAPIAATIVAPASSTSASAPVSAQPALGRDNLQRIGGINAEVERVLNVQGVGKYNQIASWVEKDTTRFDRLLGYEGRIARENWIEQAQILSRNGETAYSRQFDLQHSVKSSAPALTPAPAAVAVAVPKVAVPAAPAATVAATVAAVTAATTAAVAKVATSATSLVPEPPRPTRLPDSVAEQIRPAPVAPAPMPPTAAAPVVAAPVTTPVPVVTMPAAASIAAGVSTVPMPTRTGELAGLRSVRSEAYSAAPVKSGPDDLKRIRGVGVLIERKLNSMGINSYAQIANWTSAEIDRVSQVLDFKGKVERENWVEQARILSAGGQTEFSRRVDRGDDLNKPK